MFSLTGVFDEHQSDLKWLKYRLITFSAVYTGCLSIAVVDTPHRQQEDLSVFPDKSL
ncbi:hypothetical protein KDX31_02265 [Amphritea atlantica]|uniref:Uncharacterized protein n=1 Tax=Amphritea atlantica TaxID=355243 RepID=A0ABY5GVP5_9GAMM|nr:hypothetical protein KDX31_02265 [Amphritea atlantica]